MSYFKLGCKPREYNPSVPHFSALLSKMELAPLPRAINWSNGMADNLGFYLNDKIGDCTSAAYYHARQVWNFNVEHKEDSDPDKDALRLYEWSAGYNPKDPNTDQGATCQQVLKYILKHGAPVGKAMHWHRLIGFVEVDPRNLEDIKRTVYETGCCYIGFDVPSYLMPEDGDPPDLWQLQDHNADILDGHCVILVGFTDDNFDVISWGRRYVMSHDFFHRYTREAYGMIDAAWFNSKSIAPLGLSLADVEQQMSAIKLAA